MNAKKNQPAGRARFAHPRPLAIAVALFLAVALAAPSAEILGSSALGYGIDLPEGWALADKKGHERYHFTQALYGADLQIAIYPANQFQEATKALSFVASQFGSKGNLASLEWRRRKAAITQLSFAGYGGWAIALELSGGKGWIVLACYTKEDRATALEPLIVSTLDSIATDEGSWFEPGPMTAFAYMPEKPITVPFDLGTGKLDIPFDTVDAEANQSIVDREFSLLTGYLDTPLVYEAWKRYYRLIYRDAWARFAKASFIVGNELPQKPEELAAALLSWTQGFTYERNPSGSDFVNLPDSFASKRGDCDSRAMLMVLILNQLGVDAILLVSPEYSHAVCAVDCPGKGARYRFGGKDYLIADTTAKVGIGLIAEDMADPSKWFAVSFYAFPQKAQGN